VNEDLPTLTYLSFDPVSDGVGASQVLPYVEAMGRRGLDVALHSFERDASPAVARRLEDAGVRWMPHGMGPRGPAGGAFRTAAGARLLRRAPLVHARAHLAGAAAVLGRPQRWVWDVRSLWTEQRIDMGTLRRGSAAERTLRLLERRAACTSDAVVVLSSAAVPALEKRTGCPLAHKVRVISACVDLDRFGLANPPDPEPVRLLLSGTLNGLYDVGAMIALAQKLDRLTPAVLEWAGRGPSPWERELRAAGTDPRPVSFEEMPARLAASHAGLCLLRTDGPSAVAATPTKVGEFLATGRPVVVSAGLGDLPTIIDQHRCGVVVEETTDEALDRAAGDLLALLADPALAARCRSAAEAHFDLRRGVDALVECYARVVTAGR
jgi:glycosyltransferase involved in cell wall biosynthesis